MTRSVPAQSSILDAAMLATRLWPLYDGVWPRDCLPQPLAERYVALAFLVCPAVAMH